MFEMFAKELLHEAGHGETPQYVPVSKAMPNLSHQFREQHGNLMNIMSSYHQSIKLLDEKFGAKWRASDNCRKAYSRRQHIWEAII